VKTAAFVLEPVDLLFFRDARPLGPGFEASSALPAPQTIAGALRTALLRETGFDLGAFSREARRQPLRPPRDVLSSLGAPADVLDARFSGPFLAQRPPNGEWEVFFAAPRTLYALENGQLVRAIPAGNRTSDEFVRRNTPSARPELAPVWLRDDDGADTVADRLITLRGLKDFLEGRVPEARTLRHHADFYTIDRRTSVGIDYERSAASDGLLFTNGYLNLKRDATVQTALLVELTAAEPVLKRLEGMVVRLGGEGRCATVSRLKAAPGGGIASWSAGNSTRSVLVFLTAADFGPGMVPEIAGVRVCAAAFGRPVARSGFDIARSAPRPTRWLVPAGSVFFVEGALPDTQSLASDPEARNVGEAVFVKGAWNT
jgi:CRISPR-associated protein Cmr3